MDFKSGVELVSYLQSKSYNPRMRRKLAELEELLISLRRENNRLKGIY